MTAKSISVSPWLRLLVGSSKIRIFGWVTSARAISTTCCSPMLNLPAARSRGKSACPSCDRARRACSAEARRLIHPIRPGSAPRTIFSLAERWRGEVQLLGRSLLPPSSTGVLWVLRLIGAARQFHGSTVGAMGAAQDLDQSALAGSVFADQGVNFSRRYVERYVFQGHGGAEPFANLDGDEAWGDRLGCVFKPTLAIAGPRAARSLRCPPRGRASSPAPSRPPCARTAASSSTDQEVGLKSTS